MTIHGSPWDKIKQVEQELQAHIDRLDGVVSAFNTQLLAFDQRLVSQEESKSVAKRKTVQKKNEDNS